MRAALLILLACQTGGTEPRRGVEIVDAPKTDDVATFVRGQLGHQRRVVVYVGASWCEPCKQIHDAIVAHQLDDAFPDLTLVSFDLDRDGEALKRAGYTSTYIPLFALPEPDGHAGAHSESGGKKDIDNVPLLVDKLHRLLGT